MPNGISTGSNVFTGFMPHNCYISQWASTYSDCNINALPGCNANYVTVLHRKPYSTVIMQLSQKSTDTFNEYSFLCTESMHLADRHLSRHSSQDMLLE